MWKKPGVSSGKRAIPIWVRARLTTQLPNGSSSMASCGHRIILAFPSFDIPNKLIDQDSREFRIYNRSSTNDHATHLVGYKEMGNHTWFLIKDSAGQAYTGQHKGYFFFRDDYVRLKVLTLIVHRDAVQEILEKCQKNQAKAASD